MYPTRGPKPLELGQRIYIARVTPEGSSVRRSHDELDYCGVRTEGVASPSGLWPSSFKKGGKARQKYNGSSAIAVSDSISIHMVEQA